MTAEEFLKSLYKLDRIWDMVDDAEYNEAQILSFAERYSKLRTEEIENQNEELVDFLINLIKFCDIDEVLNER